MRPAPQDGVISMKPEKTKTGGWEPAFTLVEQLAAETSLGLSSCYQCKKCSSGCPLTFAMDLPPDQVIRLALLGQEARLLRSRTIWVCSACETCTTRCPNGVDIAGVMDWLKEEALRQGKTLAQPEVAAFHRFFLESIRDNGGRLPEARLIRRFTLFRFWRRPDAGALLDNLKIGWQLWRRGRLRLVGPPALRGQAEIRRLFADSGSSTP
jgi:heterodisulfide reductase subunit C